MPNEATDGLAPSVLDSVSGEVRAGSYELPPASDENSTQTNREFGLASFYRSLIFTQGDNAGPKTGNWCLQKEMVQTQMSNEATDGLAPSGFDHFSGAVRADSRVFPSTSEEDPKRETAGSDSRRAREAWCSRSRILHAQIPTRLLTLPLKTFRTKWYRSGSPHSIFHRGPLRHLSWTTRHILARSSIGWPKRPSFSKTIEQWGSSCRGLVQTHANASVEVCTTLTPLLGTGRSKMPCYLELNSRRMQR